MVADWYGAQGFTILARRLRTASGELDLVVADGTTLAFVEVKARARLTMAIEAVTPRQQRRLAGAAAVVLAQYPEWARPSTRFDVVLVVAGEVVPMPDAFRPDAG